MSVGRSPTGARPQPPRVLLIGMMGAGKTTVGTLLAERWHCPYRDSDAEVERMVGKSVPEILREQGEPAFRAAESAVLKHALAEPGPVVVSVAGGAVLDPANRGLLGAGGTVVWLRARVATLAARVGDGAGRPLLDGHPQAALSRLVEVRRPLYAEVAEITIDVDEMTPEAVADEIAQRVEEAATRRGNEEAGAWVEQAATRRGNEDADPLITVPVRLGARSYDVLVGDGACAMLPKIVSALSEPAPRRAAVVTQAPIRDSGWFAQLDPGLAFDVHLVPQGERAKSMDVVHDLCRAFQRRGLSRGDVVVAVGGGVVTDVAGFAAAVYLRGVRYVNVATTLLAQVDAAIGGKTGVNLPEGKNLVGAFWQPRAVLCDTLTLGTLSPRELRCGRGEMAKYAFLGAGRGTSLLSLPLSEQVARCAALKAEVVAADEREGGRRAVLNYGHTLAHALETVVGRDELRHGEAVAVGLVFAALLASRLGRIDDERVALHRMVVEGFGLPTQLPPGLDAHVLLDAMRRDKKAHHDLTFVLDGSRGVEVVRGVGASDVLATLAEMAEAASRAVDASGTEGAGP